MGRAVMIRKRTSHLIVILEEIEGLKFYIFPYVFFQVNSKMFGKLLFKLKENLEPEFSNNVYDLYSGVGTISLYLSNYCRNVIGFEIMDEAVNSAELNRKINGVDNCKFVKCDVKKVFSDVSDMRSKYGKPETIILDPPRAGVHRKVLKGVLEIYPDIIIYVSCNLESLCDDLRMLTKNYRISKIQVFDFFPQTYHIETMVKLCKYK